MAGRSRPARANGSPVIPHRLVVLASLVGFVLGLLTAPFGFVPI